MKAIIQQPKECFAACVASIFEVPLESVPHVDDEVEGEGFWNPWFDWFRTRNIEPIFQHISETCEKQDCESCAWRPKGYAILTQYCEGKEGKSHAMVLLDGKVIHNPAPSGAMPEGSAKCVIYFQVLDPSKLGIGEVLWKKVYEVPV